MYYIFVFLGEFGFELLNWQGTIRKFAQTISSDDKIVCCSRANLYPIYEMADLFIDISDVDAFRQSVASMYSGFLFSDVADVDFRHSLRRDLKTWAFQRRMRAEVRDYVLRQLKAKLVINSEKQCVFVFSDEGRKLNGCKFGALPVPSGFWQAFEVQMGSWLRAFFPALMRIHDRTRELLGWPVDRQPDGEVYERLDVQNNVYAKINPDLSVAKSVEEKLGRPLTKPYILCQTRRRDCAQPSSDALPWKKVTRLVELLTTEMDVVLLSFDTGRYADSYSEFELATSGIHYHCTSFPDQACLIHFAQHCLCFTEGDFGSHIYVPPFMGRDVTAIAPRSIYEIGSTPIDFWNQNVFRFDGQIIPEVAEEVLVSNARRSRLARQILSRTKRRRGLNV
jgi:hypothetical protein